MNARTPLHIGCFIHQESTFRSKKWPTAPWRIGAVEEVGGLLNIHWMGLIQATPFELLGFMMIHESVTWRLTLMPPLGTLWAVGHSGTLAYNE